MGPFFLTRDEGETWIKLNSPLRNLAFRYPMPFQDNIVVTGVGWRSLVLRADVGRNQWRVIFDATKAVSTKLMARMAMVGDYLFLGDEMETGKLLRVNINSLRPHHPFLYSISDRLGAKKMVSPMLLLSESKGLKR